ncbi:MAG: hypothetical protein JO089_04540 [Alphaproteobacteria bacterium]|nr:hypothetical protein [Alphaproteobacteria bacterium]
MTTTTINPALYSGQYYQLSGQPTGAGDDAATGAQSLGDSLLQALNATPGSATDMSSFAGDLVDLSPQAQSILGLGGAHGASASGSAAGTGFVLSTQQQQQISAILAKYKDAPMTQDTYNQIQNDLKAAGLSPDQLALQNQMRSFNPTQTLMNALDGIGDSSDSINAGDNSTGQANAARYMQQIIRQWQSISTTNGSGASAAAPTSLIA